MILSRGRNTKPFSEKKSLKNEIFYSSWKYYDPFFIFSCKKGVSTPFFVFSSNKSFFFARWSFLIKTSLHSVRKFPSNLIFRNKKSFATCFLLSFVLFFHLCYKDSKTSKIDYYVFCLLLFFAHPLSIIDHLLSSNVTKEISLISSLFEKIFVPL